MIPAAFAPALQALDRRLDPGAGAPLAVALSGGGDSLALLHIARAWAAGVRRPLWALTVDHGLHPDSGAWTKAAGEAAGRLGVPWRGLAWAGPKPANGLTAAARTARHALLAAAARALGAGVLLFGHTADDIAESELIRVETPAHGRLAEWSPSPAWPQGRGVFALRPLLALRRNDLRAWLAASGIGWLDDPANADPRFARSRARDTLADRRDVAPPALAPQGPCAWADLDGAAAASAYGGVDLDLTRLSAATRPRAALAKALLCVAGETRPPPGAALERLWTRLAAGEAITATLSGARVQAADGYARLTRELGRRPPAPAPLSPAAAETFDGRFELLAQLAGWRVAPLAGHAAALPGRERDALHRVPAAARPGLPVLLGPAGQARLPRPLGEGPACARCLVGERLAAAWGLTARESRFGAAMQRLQPRSAAPPLILS